MIGAHGIVNTVRKDPNTKWWDEIEAFAHETWQKLTQSWLSWKRKQKRSLYNGGIISVTSPADNDIAIFLLLNQFTYPLLNYL